MGQVASIIASQPEVKVDALTALPTSNDPKTWAYPTTEDYRAVYASCQATNNELLSGLTFFITGKFPDDDDDVMVVALGVTKDGDCLGIAILATPVKMSVLSAYQFQINGIVNPVQQR